MTSRILNLLLLAGILVLIGAGCRGPRLVSRPLTPEQSVWAEVVARHYPGWRAPFFSPAVSCTQEKTDTHRDRLQRDIPSRPEPHEDIHVGPAEDPEFVPAQ
jgi:hypothetical protein